MGAAPVAVGLGIGGGRGVPQDRRQGPGPGRAPGRPQRACGGGGAETRPELLVPIPGGGRGRAPWGAPARRRRRAPRSTGSGSVSPPARSTRRASIRPIGTWWRTAPDLVLFLGDYIYEGDPGSKGAVRQHQNPEPKDVAGYRARYATYKSDPLLQAAHAAAPWSVIWDDHEVSNDYGGSRDQDASDPVAFLRRRAAAYQVYYEHMPLRRRTIPVGPDMLLYRSLDWGRLAQIQLVDDRQYRSEPVCKISERAQQAGQRLRRTPRSAPLDAGPAAGGLADGHPGREQGPVEPAGPADPVRSARACPAWPIPKADGLLHRRLGWLARHPRPHPGPLARGQGQQSGDPGRRHPRLRRLRPGRAAGRPAHRHGIRRRLDHLVRHGGDGGQGGHRPQSAHQAAGRPQARLWADGHHRQGRPGGPARPRRRGRRQFTDFRPGVLCDRAGPGRGRHRPSGAPAGSRPPRSGR